MAPLGGSVQDGSEGTGLWSWGGPEEPACGNVSLKPEQAGTGEVQLRNIWKEKLVVHLLSGRM